MLPETFEKDIASRLDAWLYTVCRNVSIDMLRKNARSRSVDDAGWQSFAASTETSAELAEVKEQADLAVRLLDTLPVRQREVMHLKFQCQMDYGQISEITGMTFNNVAVTLHLGLKSLRQKMEQALIKGGHCEL